MGRINLYYDVQVELEGSVIRWENHTCLLSAVSQLWIGRPYDGLWGLVKDTDQEGLNVELNSGYVYSFISASRGFLAQAYELLCRTIQEGGSKGKHTMDFERLEVQVYEEPVEEEEEVIPEPMPPRVNPLSLELAVLREHCEKKEHTGTAVLQLLDDIEDCSSGSCKKDVQELYKMFVQLALINDCNELGLNLLINDVKSHVYRG